MARGGSRAAARSKMERFVIIVNVFQPLTIITERSILDLAAVLDPPLMTNILARQNFPKWGKDELVTKTVSSVRSEFAKTAGTR